jgi:diketogulonate reductase-like aldo/keto reductase
MDARPFGSIGITVPTIGLGTWNMEHASRRDAIAAIRRALELGLVHIDTAEMYGSGKVESLVGEALEGRRDDAFLVSKVLPRHANYEGTLRACEASLRRLKTDRLDLYLLHWRGEHPLAETFRAFEDLRAQGKIRTWGVSNFDDRDLEEAWQLGRPACNQVLYHLDERTIEHRVIPWCEQHGIAIVAYSPLGAAGGFPRSRALGAIAERCGATPRQVALAFLTRRRSVFAIPKSSQAKHVDELARRVALDGPLIAELDVAFPLGPWRGLPTL